MSFWTFPRDRNGKIELVVNDLVLNPDVCNFSCQYCLCHESPNWLAQASFDKIRDKFLYAPGMPLQKRLDTIMSFFEEHFNTSILRMAGGEVFQVMQVTDFFEKYHHKFDKLQVVTNTSYLTPPMVQKLKKIPNIILHLSLDGHTLELNQYRVSKQGQHDRLIDHFKSLIDANIQLEIGSVLTKANTPKYKEFLEFLLPYEGKITVYPFPVRGELAANFLPSVDDIKEFGKILDSFERYQGILPPFQYMKELLAVLIGPKRTFQCHLPKTMIQSFDDGNITPCPNAWSGQLGNVLEGPKEVLKNVGTHKMYNIFLQERPRLSICQQCFTSLDMINLYMGGLISHQEMAAIPLYEGNRTLDLLKKIKLKSDREKIEQLEKKKMKMIKYQTQGV